MSAKAPALEDLFPDDHGTRERKARELAPIGRDVGDERRRDRDKQASRELAARLEEAHGRR